MSTPAAENLPMRLRYWLILFAARSPDRAMLVHEIANLPVIHSGSLVGMPSVYLRVA